MNERDAGSSRDHNNGAWNRMWSCISHPFRKRRRSQMNDERRLAAENEERDRDDPWRNMPRWEVIRRDVPRREVSGRRASDTRNEVRKRYRAPSPETFDKLRQAIIQVEEASNENKSLTKLLSDDEEYKKEEVEIVEEIINEDIIEEMDIPQEVVDIPVEEETVH